MEGHNTATLLHESAHDVRNQLATLSALTRLLDDAELRADVNEATSSVMRMFERAIVLARIELDVLPAASDIELGVLVTSAQRRAAREGAAAGCALRLAVERDAACIVHVQVVLVERLLCDLLHVCTDDVSISLTQTGAELTCTVDTHAWERAQTVLGATAEACAASIELRGDVLTCCVPLSA